jgi:ribosomal protein S18 acetylase RimI-like enzyme
MPYQVQPSTTRQPVRGPPAVGDRHLHRCARVGAVGFGDGEDSSAMVKVRPALSADVLELRAIVNDAFGVYRPRMDRDPAPMGADYASLVSANQVWVAAQGEEILGLVVLVPAADHLYLQTIAVRPRAQGLGVGRRLLELADAEAARQGLPAVVLCTNEVMTENLDYYPRRGYRRTHRLEEDGFRRVFFRKPVPPAQTSELRRFGAAW